jgi:hypothetical protein
LFPLFEYSLRHGPRRPVLLTPPPMNAGGDTPRRFLVELAVPQTA